MRTISCLFIIPLFGLFLAAEVQIAVKIEDSIRAAEPEWRCSHPVYNAPPPEVSSENRVLSVWEHEPSSVKRERVDMLISEVASSIDGKVSLRSIRDGKVASGWKVKPYSIGDEGYLAIFEHGSRYEIHFRKGTVIIRVKSDSIRLAERFARYAEAQI